MSEKIRMALAFLLGALFVYAGALKASDPARFFMEIEKYEIIPWRPATIASAFYLPWLEIICGVAVVLRSLRIGAFLLVITMLLSFTAALAQAWIRGLDISCGCFGGASDHSEYLLWIGRDTGLLVIALMLAISHRKANKRK